jgi:nucleotide-binding universal stress UspA family protein
MPTIRHILCPVDFSETSAHAVELAFAIARPYRARISALHVCAPASMPVLAGEMPMGEALEADLPRAREQTARAFQAAGAGVDVDILVEVGDPARRILDRAVSLAPDLIVMGTHGVSGFERVVLGSVTERVLRKAGCPVLTAPPRMRASSTLPFARVLCAVDFSDWSLEALTVARSLARESGAGLTLLHVLEWPWREPPEPAFAELPLMQAEALRSYRRHLETTTLTRLQKLGQEAAQEGVAAEPLVLHGKSYVEILRAADQRRADLIVLGVHGRPAVDMLLLGSTTNQVVRAATCPVLTVRR